MFLEKLMGTTEFDVVIKLLTALICGGILGLEREHKKRAAGFRTYMLVCVGAALVMIINEYLTHIFNGIDPARMGAQVISGIGFLGVGTIIVTRNNHVKGLTTAAGLWTTACVGLAIGVGYYFAAIFGTALVFLVFTMFHSMDKRIRQKSKSYSFYVEFEDIADVGKFIRTIREKDIKLYDMELLSSQKIVNGKGVAGIIAAGYPVKVTSAEASESFKDLEGIIYIEEI